MNNNIHGATTPNQLIEGFVSYMLSFYGDASHDPVYQMDMTRDEVLHALVALLLETPKLKFEGDSVDRERVRDAVLKNRE